MSEEDKKEPPTVEDEGDILVPVAKWKALNRDLLQAHLKLKEIQRGLHLMIGLCIED